MEYENPRNLEVVKDPQEEIDEASAAENDQKLINQYNRQLAMFKSAGWNDLAVALAEELQHCVIALTGNRLNTMEAVAYVRGQVQVIQHILALPEATKQRRALVQQQIEDRKQASI